MCVGICVERLDSFLPVRGNDDALFRFRGAAFFLAALPVLPVFQWSFYNQNGICLPLPIVSGDFRGYKYAFSIFIVLNFALFIFIGAGQLFIYFSIRSSAKAARSLSTIVRCMTTR